MLDFSVIYGFFHTSLKIELDERERETDGQRDADRENFVNNLFLLARTTRHFLKIVKLS